MTIGLYALSGSFVAGRRSDEKTLNIVAHQDDDLLFLNPDVLIDIESGRMVRTVYLTAGDAGLGADYWTSRQAGVMAAYAEMVDVSNDWDESDIGVPGKDIPLYTLRDNDQVSIAFIHMPDGNMDGSGFASTGYESMEKLWKSEIGEIGTVDESGTRYTREDLINTLTQMINEYDPDYMNAQNYIDDFGSGDHSDHTAGALFANEAAVASIFPGAVIAYEGYPMKALPPNVSGEDLVNKKAAFYTYGAYDSSVCTSDESCAGTEYELWLARDYPRN
ncbi:hypothetical protein P175DRAFT_0438256 [Aspergillus ochraceoroseus IBT 24754]|uniref:N-acetylglucosaminylphosphatidylinositol deacetylase n=2 Tax=Aspergillus ochraceoroseus TaxID=138278 RepID=A0A2T5LYC3_9EURO|nr:uncharacterized protein P175DRAFT_0438256 [Aspergillus ochraceoroseus IBT 24754]KKK24457.1 hypothetical protein AOCH_006006 [Aspergillus ochraceoroseus]PTU21287.1 hypothetical protein P175DRAFT_0438256 [Aspergillus ochraceoroseus IBT 24754]